MNAILNFVLSVRGITALTMLLLAVLALLYCRIVTGMGLIMGLRSIPALSGGRGPASPINSRFGKLIGLRVGAPAYESISLTGGDGKGTVAEVLARQTELKIAKGEEVMDEFTRDLAEGATEIPNPTHNSQPHVVRADQMTEEFLQRLEQTGPQPLESEPPIEQNGVRFDGYSVGSDYIASDEMDSEPPSESRGPESPPAPEEEPLTDDADPGPESATETNLPQEEQADDDTAREPSEA